MVKQKMRSSMTNNLNKLKVTQIISANRRPRKQTLILKGLGLSRLHRPSILEDTPSIRGMIEKVKHLVKYEAIV